MKAYRVRKINWVSTPVEEIDVYRVTDINYLDRCGWRLLETDHYKVFTDRQEAIDYAIDLANKDIRELERQKQVILDRVNKVESMLHERSKRND